MPETRTAYEHIVLDDAGVARISGTRWKVSLLVAARQAYGWSPEEIGIQHPDLSLGQIYSALAYHADHAEAIDAEVDRDLQSYDEARELAGSSPVLEKLRAKRTKR